MHDVMDMVNVLNILFQQYLGFSIQGQPDTSSWLKPC
jgi:hypothetical protein